MGSQKGVTWEIEPHTRAKHEILRRYLQAWFPIMARGNSRIIVLDGFAGPGQYNDGSRGSPLIAIDTLLSHRAALSYGSEVIFYFIEADVSRSQYLDNLLRATYRVGSLPRGVTWHVVTDSFDEHMTALLDNLDENRSYIAPTFAFIDPFGYSHTPMNVIARLMEHPKCEVLVNFMFEEANRFMNWDKPEHDVHYDRLFGADDWRAVRQSNLTPAEREHHIRELYARKLSSVGGATYMRAFRMRNKSNRTDYYLFFGTKNLTGLDRMKQAMWKIDPTGAYDFSDTTNPNQAVLFEAGPDFGPLSNLIVARFAGQTVSVQQVEDFVIADTAFNSSHYKVQVLKPLEIAGRVQVIAPPQGRRMGTYANKDLKLHFL